MIHFSVEGSYLVEHAAYYALIGFLASLFGVLIVRRILVSLKRTDIIVWFLIFLLIASLLLEVPQLFVSVFDKEKTQIFSFGEYCKDN